MTEKNIFALTDDDLNDDEKELEEDELMDDEEGTEEDAEKEV